MKTRILKTEADHAAALAYVATLMDAEAGSPEKAELELFSMLVEQYEQEHYPIAPPDPVDAILFRMDQQGLTRNDMAVYIGSQSKVSEVAEPQAPSHSGNDSSLARGIGHPRRQPVTGIRQEAGTSHFCASRWIAYLNEILISTPLIQSPRQSPTEFPARWA